MWLSYSSVPLCLLLLTPATILSTFLTTCSAFLPLHALCVLIPGFRHQLLGRRFGFFPLFGDLWQSSRNVWAPPQNGGRGLSFAAPAGAHTVHPSPPAPPRIPATCSHLPASRPYLRPQPGAPRLPNRRLNKVVKGSGSSPPSSAPQRIARVPSSDHALWPPEAEACSSSLARDAHQGLGRSPLSLEPGATHVSESAAPGQRKPLYSQWVAPRTVSSTAAGETRTGRGVAHRSRQARAGPRRLAADAGARRASQPARALE